MTAFVTGFILVAVVATVIALPLFNPTDIKTSSFHASESLLREKSIALLAIKEAQFDHAMGKLTDEDYSVLRSEYEERAMHAIRGMEAEVDARESGGEGAQGQYCHRCGQRFDETHRFCASCGTARLGAGTPGDS